MKLISHRPKVYLFNSLLLLLLLLGGAAPPTTAAEVVLNSTLIVTVPEAQSGDPGDFLTYVLRLENRSPNPVNLEVEYFSPNQWSVLGEPSLTIPAQTANQFFPVTVLVPGTAPANLEEAIQVRFKPTGTAFALVPVIITAKVNPVSAVNFITPPPQPTTYGTKAAYQVVVVNNGNTAEQFAVKAVSLNDWSLRVTPATFSLNPGESLAVTVEEQIPTNAPTALDQIQLTFSWRSQQKVVTLQTQIVDQLEQLGDNYYLWRGQLSLSHSDLTELETAVPGNSFFLQGQWRPDAWAQFYLDNLFDAQTRRWFSDFKYQNWELKTGVFALGWAGLVEPGDGSGNLYLTNQAKQGRDDFISVYAWEADPVTLAGPALGLEAHWLKHSTLRLLRQEQPASDQTILEWEYWNQPQTRQRWSGSLAADLADSEGRGAGLRYFTAYDRWYWNASYQQLDDLGEYLERQKFWLNLGTNPMPQHFSTWLQLNWESSQTSTNVIDDSRIDLRLLWPSNYLLQLSQSRLLLDNTVNTALTLESPLWEQAAVKNRYWFDYILDHSSAADSSFSRLTWLTEYQTSRYWSWLCKPQLERTDSGSASDRSNLGLGFKSIPNYGPELTLWSYYYFNDEPRWQLDLSLIWRIYQYQLTLGYLGQLDSGSFNTDYLSLTLYQRFSFPVKKPLATIEGVAYLDRNHNGSYDAGEPVVPRVELLIDDQFSVLTDERGFYQINGLEPGSHRIKLNNRYEVIYQPVTAETVVTLKAFQTAPVNLALLRSQNLVGTVYYDQNSNQLRDATEIGVAGIPLILKNQQGQAVQQTTTDPEGSFVFYQLAAETYQLVIDPELLPENLGLPPGSGPITINADHLEELPPLELQLVPYEKPIEIINPSGSGLTVSLDRELVNLGQRLKINITSPAELQQLTLLLPTGATIVLPVKPAQRSWSYLWTIPATSPTGQVKLICRAVTAAGNSLEESLNLIILAPQ